MLYVSSSSKLRQSQNQIQPWHRSASPPTHSTPHFAGRIFVELWPTGYVKGVWLNIQFCSKCRGWQKSQHSLITPPLDWPDRCYWLVQVVCFISRFDLLPCPRFHVYGKVLLLQGQKPSMGAAAVRLCKCRYVLITLNDVLKLIE
jgi:hypothetical protein